MIVAEGFSPFSPSEAVSLVHGHRPEGLVYAIDDVSQTILPDLAPGMWLFQATCGGRPGGHGRSRPLQDYV